MILSNDNRPVYRRPKTVDMLHLLAAANGGDRRDMSDAELIACLEGGEPGKSAANLMEMFVAARAARIISVAEIFGSTAARTVALYEKVKAELGRRSESFEKGLMGSFVFTSIDDAPANANNTARPKVQNG
jgi:hypothetical protein